MKQLSPKQKEFWNAPFHKWHIKHGATRSGKTYMDYFMIPKRIRERTGKDGLVVMMGNTKGTLQRNVIEPMQNLYGNAVSSIRSDNTATIFGERVHCLGADSKKHVDRLRGTSIKYCYGDEIVTWEQEVFEMLKSRLDKPYSCFDGTCNPSHQKHWVKQFIDSDADIFRQKYALDDNPFLDAVVAEELKREYAGTVYYDRYIRGEWVAADGLIYPHFMDCVVDVLPAQFDRYVVSMDYGIQNATAMILWGRHAGVWYAIKEYYHSGRETRNQKTDDEYFEEYRKLTRGLRISKLLVDPSAASFIVLASRRGAPVANADNDVLDGIRETSSAIRRGRIKVYRSCKHLVDEAACYLWDAKAGEDRPVKVDDHAMDAMRYFVYTTLSEKKMGIAAR